MKPAIKHYTLLSILIISFTISFLSCKKSGPTEPAELKPGSMDYQWKLDTIYIPGERLYITKIWGSDPENLWALGFGASARMLVWHFDGKSWRTDSVTQIFSPLSVFGFGRNNVWIGNRENAFWRSTDSRTWRKFSDYSLAEYPYTGINCIWGISPDNIYAVGFSENRDKSTYKMALMHFDGKQWSFIPTPDIRAQFLSIRQHSKSGIYLLTACDISPTDGTFYMLYSYNGKDLTELYKGRERASIENMNGETYIDIEQQVYKYSGGKLHLWKNFSSTNYRARVWGRNESDFFYSSPEGLGHYNGSDLKIVYQSSLAIFESVIFDKEVFFLARDFSANKSVVLHGLKKVEGER